MAGPMILEGYIVINVPCQARSCDVGRWHIFFGTPQGANVARELFWQTPTWWIRWGSSSHKRGNRPSSWALFFFLQGLWDQPCLLTHYAYFLGDWSPWCCLSLRFCVLVITCYHHLSALSVNCIFVKGRIFWSAGPTKQFYPNKNKCMYMACWCFVW